MKKIALCALFLCTVTIFGCGSSDENTTPGTGAAHNSDIDLEAANKGPLVALKPADIAAGEKQIQQNDCLTCHKEKGKMVGPGYDEVALKYRATEANIDMLSNKIINGGSGHWGNVDMMAHSALTGEQAHQMVAYILSVK